MSEDDLLEKHFSGGGGLWKKPPPDVQPPAPAQRPGTERRTPASSPSVIVGQDDADAPVIIFPVDRVYEAQTLRNKSGRLLIVRAASVGRCPGYHYLQDIKIDLFTNSGFVLLYPGLMNVHVKGWNLQSIWYAILTDHCFCIREFHDKLYDRPAKGAALIESIKVVALDEESNDTSEEEPA